MGRRQAQLGNKTAYLVLFSNTINNNLLKPNHIYYICKLLNLMRYMAIITLGLLFSQNATSQIYEVGVFAGGSNVIGDIGATNYIAPNQTAFGALIKWNRSTRHSWRASIIYANIEGQDQKSSDPRRQQRGYTFNNTLTEVSAGMEFTFLDFNLHDPDTQFTPYLYSGISVAYHENYAFKRGVYTSEDTGSWAYGIPITLGVKSNITNHLVLGAEIGARYTFSDEIDGSVPDWDRERTSGAVVGNPNSNDWYVFTGLTLTYTFGQKPCYCNF